MMDIIAWIVFGALAGWIASIIMRTNDEQGAVGNIIVGIVGAIIGGFIMRTFGAEVTGFNVGSLIVAIAGAMLLLFIMRIFGRGNAHV